LKNNEKKQASPTHRWLVRGALLASSAVAGCITLCSRQLRRWFRKLVAVEEKLIRRWILGCLAALLVLSSATGCWDSLTGPAIRNGYAQPIVVTATFESGNPLTFELKPGQAFWQRPPSRALSALRVEALDGTLLRVINESDVRAAGISEEKRMLVVSDESVRAINPPP
jgi:hypothetical protein